MNDTTISIQLGAEELLFLLNRLQIKSLPGLGENPTEGLTDDQIKRALAAGFNSLRARGWAEVSATDRSQVSIDQTIVALLVTCATAPQLLLVKRQPIDAQTQTRYFHFGDHLTVIHAVSQPGVHQLVGTVERSQTLTIVADLLHLAQQPSPAANAVVITQALFDVITQALREKRQEDAFSALRESGMVIDLSNCLLESLDSMQSNTMLALLHLRSGQVKSAPTAAGFSLMESRNGFWLLETYLDDKGAAQLRIEPVSAAECLQRIEKMLPEITLVE